MTAFLRKPMPPEAKMVFKGVIFEVWQWEQKMYDGSVQTFERLRRPDTVEILAVVGDKLIVHNEEQPDSEPFVTVPAGRVDAGEEPLAAAKRELLEETGYVSDDWQLMKQEEVSGKIEWTINIYVARNCIKKEEAKPEGGEKITSRLVSLDELFTISEDPAFRSTTTRTVLWRARLDDRKKKELQTLLFGNS